MKISSLLAIGLVVSGCAMSRQSAKAQNANTPNDPGSISVDVTANRHPINPLIYGVAHASQEQLELLNAPINRSGGNNTSRYNWKLNADNRGNDWFFESIADDNAKPGGRASEFLSRSKAAGAAAMWTVPMIDWVANLGPNREKLVSYSVAKYGAQQKTDEWSKDAGNGTKADGSPVTGNDPSDANTRNSPAFQGEFLRQMVAQHGNSQKGGFSYYILDNEPALWNSTHRDVQPQGLHMQELLDKSIAYAKTIKTVDPGAKIIGPEEWGWTGYIYSAYDAQMGPKIGWNRDAMPDRKLMKGQDAMPYYLAQMRRAEADNGKRLLDAFTLHIYPQGGEFGDNTSNEMQLRRNRSTRALWDNNYKDETWINDTVRLIPRMKEWMEKNYPGTPIGITEYNWGAENHINGATAQADILGIFGREGLDLATRWTTPDAKTPTFKAMQLFRNYDGKKGGFGDVSVQTSSQNPDVVSAFAAQRQADGALTVIVINKKLAEGEQSAPVSLDIKNFASASAQVWQLDAKGEIKQLDDVALENNQLETSVPNQSVTLFVIAKG